MPHRPVLPEKRSSRPRTDRPSRPNLRPSRCRLPPAPLAADRPPEVLPPRRRAASAAAASRRSAIPAEHRSASTASGNSRTAPSVGSPFRRTTPVRSAALKFTRRAPAPRRPPEACGACSNGRGVPVGRSPMPPRAVAVIRPRPRGPRARGRRPRPVARGRHRPRGARRRPPHPQRLPQPRDRPRRRSRSPRLPRRRPWSSPSGRSRTTSLVSEANRLAHILILQAADSHPDPGCQHPQVPRAARSGTRSS
jgi:hypothetical protein